MTEPFIIKVEHQLTLNIGDYLVITVDETGRARYKHLPAALAAVIQRDATKKSSKKRPFLGPVLRGAKREEFITKLLATLKTAQSFEVIQKKLPDYRKGQLYSTLASLMKSGRVEKNGNRYVAKEVK